MINSNASLTEQALGDISSKWGWIMAGGLLMVILGIVGLSMEFTMTVVSVLYLGIMMVMGGAMILISAFQAEGWKSKLWHLLIGLLYIAAGVVMIMEPQGSAVWFTLFIAAYLFVVGILRIITSFQMRGASGWGWTLLAGISALILAFMIYAEWPYSGLWAIGLFVSIDLLMQGISLISIAWAAKQAGKEMVAS
jgi:uncharacterized membrane protein HdeD (DUF308 family)